MADEGDKLPQGGDGLGQHCVGVGNHRAVGAVLLPAAVQAPEHLPVGDKPGGDGVPHVDHRQALGERLAALALGAQAGLLQVLLGQGGQVAIVVQGDRHVVALLQQRAQVDVPPAQPGDKANHPREVHHPVDRHTNAHQPIGGGGHLRQELVQGLAHLVVHLGEALPQGGELLPGQHPLAGEVGQNGLHLADVDFQSHRGPRLVEGLQEDGLAPAPRFAQLRLGQQALVNPLLHNGGDGGLVQASAAADFHPADGGVLQHLVHNLPPVGGAYIPCLGNFHGLCHSFLAEIVPFFL